LVVWCLPDWPCWLKICQFLYDDAESSVAGKKGADQVAHGEKKEDAPAPLESKNSKKKKSKKEKSSKELKEAQDQANGLEAAAVAEPDEDTASVDVKERIKKVASMKKKKSSKEMDAAAKIAASEAAARSARLAAAKKKEKSHYNQQPVRWTPLIWGRSEECPACRCKEEREEPLQPAACAVNSPGLVSLETFWALMSPVRFGPAIKLLRLFFDMVEVPSDARFGN
jgi:hypothetical protein